MLPTNNILGVRRIKKNDIIAPGRIRREGGGRINAENQFENIDDIFLSVISEHIAGDPMNEKIKWVKLTRANISQAMKGKGINISRNIVRRLLKKHGFVKRKMVKKQSTGICQYIDFQKNILALRGKLVRIISSPYG